MSLFGTEVKQCELCGKQGKNIEMFAGIWYCPECKEHVHKLVVNTPITDGYFDDFDFSRTSSKCKLELEMYLAQYDKSIDKINVLDEQTREVKEEEDRRLEQRKQNSENLRSEIGKDIIITSTSTIEGYAIKEYIEVLFGEVVVPNGILGALTSGTFFTISALDKARKMAIKNLQEQALKLGANAIVGLDVDICDLNGNGMMVSANGTAVSVEKL